MRSFQSQLSEFSQRGIRVVAISVDPVSDNLGLSEKAGLTFPLLSDPDKQVIRAYDLLHTSGHRGADIARPAEFLLDRSGTVRWVNLTSDFRVRVHGDEVLKVAEDRLHLSAQP